MLRVLSSTPVPIKKLTPLAPDSDTVPFVVMRVTVMRLLPASTSLIEMALPLASLNARTISCVVVWVVGTVLTGASFTAVTLMVTVLVSVCAPPPVLPSSLMLTVRVTLAVASCAVW
ncbi:hypothetical protein PS3A_16330 [Pseudomonas sp. 3A(2025)]